MWNEEGQILPEGKDFQTGLPWRAAGAAYPGIGEGGDLPLDSPCPHPWADWAGLWEGQLACSPSLSSGLCLQPQRVASLETVGSGYQLPGSMVPPRLAAKPSARMKFMHSTPLEISPQRPLHHLSILQTLPGDNKDHESCL